MTDNAELRVIHSLRLKGFADTPAVAEGAAVDADTAKSVLDALAAAEQARYREGRMTGWMLTAAGKAKGEELLAVELDAAGERDGVASAYAQFLLGNQDFLALCTDWQVRMIDGQQVTNEHDDADYDTAVIGRLADADAAVQPIVADLAARLDRFSQYGPRFSEALGKVQAGEREWFTKPVIESYHTVWFELHEDLLATLGIDRASEGST